MNKRVVIINGTGGVGKSTFVDLAKEKHKVMEYSSVDKVKEIARIIGWEGKKTEKDRKFLSDLKLLTADYCDMPLEDMKRVYNEFLESEEEILFLHIREPEEIDKAKKEFNAITLLILNNRIKPILSNMADANVLKYSYDYIIENSSTLKDLQDKVNVFMYYLTFK